MFGIGESNKQTTNVTTTNRNVAIQGSGIGVSGMQGSFVQGSGTVLENVIARPGATQNISIISSDALAMEANRDVAMTAIAYSNVTSLHALETLQSGQENSAALISQAVAGSNRVAMEAIPTSPEDMTKMVSSAFKPLYQTLLTIAAIVAAIYVFNKLKK